MNRRFPLCHRLPLWLMSLCLHIELFSWSRSEIWPTGPQCCGATHPKMWEAIFFPSQITWLLIVQLGSINRGLLSHWRGWGLSDLPQRPGPVSRVPNICFKPLFWWLCVPHRNGWDPAFSHSSSLVFCLWVLNLMWALWSEGFKCVSSVSPYIISMCSLGWLLLATLSKDKEVLPPMVCTWNNGKAAAPADTVLAIRYCSWLVRHWFTLRWVICPFKFKQHRR